MSSTFPAAVPVGRVIDGRFPLLRYLGGSEWSTAYLTEIEDDPAKKAAIKIFPFASVDPLATGAQWGVARTLSHPHLMPLFHAARFDADGEDLLYVVTEYADETLSQILPERPLTPEEAREMLGPFWMPSPIFISSVSPTVICGQPTSWLSMTISNSRPTSAGALARSASTIHRRPAPRNRPRRPTSGRLASFWSKPSPSNRLFGRSRKAVNRKCRPPSPSPSSPLRVNVSVLTPRTARLLPASRRASILAKLQNSPPNQPPQNQLLPGHLTNPAQTFSPAQPSFCCSSLVPLNSVGT
jgi:hypothetical protein